MLERVPVTFAGSCAAVKVEKANTKVTKATKQALGFPKVVFVIFVFFVFGSWRIASYPLSSLLTSAQLTTFHHAPM